MITTKQLNQFYGGSHILWDIDIAFERGKCVSVMGRNGVGKTTLMKCIMGLLPIASGQILLEDKELHKLDSFHRASRGIGYVPQGREIFSSLSVLENLQIGLLGNPKKPKKVPDKIYSLFPVLKEMLHRKGGDLSGGQQQQLSIARALCIDPSVLILDEPAEGIQPNIVAQIGEVIRYLVEEENMSIILVEQKVPFVKKYSDEFYILERGRVVANAKVEDLSEEIIEKYLHI